MSRKLITVALVLISTSIHFLCIGFAQEQPMQNSASPFGPNSVLPFAIDGNATADPFGDLTIAGGAQISPANHAESAPASSKAPSEAVADVQSIEVVVTAGATLQFEAEMTGVEVSAPDLLTLEVVDPHKIRVVGQKPGQTTLAATTADGKQHFCVITVLSNTVPLQNHLDRLYPQVVITTTEIQDSVLLRGTVQQPEHIAEIVEIAEQFYPRVLNQLRVAETPIKTSPASPVRLQALIVKLDHDRLRAADIRLEDLLADINAVKNNVHASPAMAQTTRRTVLSAVTAKDRIEPLLRRLMKIEAAQVLSRPQVVTQFNQPAQIQIATEQPILLIEETINGQTSVHGESRTLGTSLEVTPRLATHGVLSLQVHIKHSERIDDKAAGPLKIRSRSFHSLAKVPSDHAFVTIERPATDNSNKEFAKPTKSVRTGLLIILTPLEWHAPTTSNPSPAPTALPSPAKPARPIAVTKEGKHSAARVSTKPGQPTAPSATKPRVSLHQEIRQLRGEVGELRRDVQQLLNLIEAQHPPKPATDETSANAILERALDEKVAFAFQDRPLKLAINEVAQAARVNIGLNQTSLAEEGVSPETPITLEVRGIQLRSALNLLLDPLNLTYVVEKEVLMIVSQEFAQGPLTPINYPVGDLVVRRMMATPLHPDQSQRSDGIHPTLTTIDELEKLSQIIQSTVRPNDWDDVGGQASIQPFEPTLSLIVRQTKQGHAELAALLQQIRQQKHPQDTAVRQSRNLAPKDIEIEEITTEVEALERSPN